MHYHEIEIEKQINLAPEQYRELYEKVLNDMLAEQTQSEHAALAARLELNGILSLEIVRTLHEISNTLRDIDSKI